MSYTVHFVQIFHEYPFSVPGSNLGRYGAHPAFLFLSNSAEVQTLPIAAAVCLISTTLNPGSNANLTDVEPKVCVCRPVYQDSSA
jgi:hypothetical protein